METLQLPKSHHKLFEIDHVVVQDILGEGGGGVSSSEIVLSFINLYNIYQMWTSTLR